MSRLYGLTENDRRLIQAMANDFRGRVDQLPRELPQHLRPQKARWWPFENGTGGVIPAGAVLKISDTTTIDGQHGYEVEKPDGDYANLYAIAAMVDVPNGGRGRLTFSAETYALYTGSAPTFGDEYGPTADQWYLTKDRPGFLSLGEDSNTSGDTLSPFRIQPPTSLRGRLDGDLNAGGSQTMSLRNGSGDLGLNVTVHAYTIESGKKLVSGQDVKAERLCGTWYVMNADACSVDQA